MNDVDLKREIKKLAIAYGKPEVPEDEAIGLWRHVVEGLSDRSVTEAVNQYVRSPARFFPRAGQIAEIAREIEASTFGDRRDAGPKDWNALQDGPCPVCGAVLQLYAHDKRETWDARVNKWRKRTPDDPDPPRRYRLIHDAAAHARAGASMVGESNRRLPQGAA